MPADEAPVGKADSPRHRTLPLLIAVTVGIVLSAAAAPSASAHEYGSVLESAGTAHARPAGKSVPPSRLRAMVAAGAEYPRAIWRPASVWNYSDANRPNDVLITRIIIHVAEGGFASTYNWFASSAAQSSAHFVVGKQGQVAQMVHEGDIAWHAGNWAYNESSIGIEHEGYTRAGMFTEEEYRASARLAGYIARKYAVRPDRSSVIGHNEVPDPNHPGEWGGASHHTDPGRYWNWSRYMEYLRLYAGTTHWVVGDDSFGGFQAPGWSAVSGSGSFSHSARMAAPKRGAEPARYKISLPSGGAYDVFARWPCRSDANTGARYVLTTAGGTRTVTVNQRATCSRWVPLGTSEFTRGSDWRVEIRRGSRNRGMILADAVRFVRTGDPNHPSTPGGLSVTGKTSTSIDFSWGTSTDDIGVWGYQATVDGRLVHAGQERTFSAGSLSCGTTYEIRVRSIDRVGNRSKPRTATAATDACPLPPSGFTQTGATRTSVTLTWTASPSPVSEYLVYARTWQRIVTGTTLTKGRLPCGTRRVVHVRALDAGGGLSSRISVQARTAACS